MKVDEKTLKKTINEAIELSVIKKEGFKPKIRKFDESVDLIINIKDINLKDPKNRIDKELILPNEVSTLSNPNVCVIAADEILLKAKNLKLETLDSAGLKDLNSEEKKSKKRFVKKFDFFIVEDKLMRDVARYLARFLGPAGKMPKPFPTGYGIISNPEDLVNAVERYKKVIRIQMKKQLMIQTKIGKKSMDVNKLFENIRTIIDFIADLMPHKYNNIRSIIIKTSMGKPAKVT